MSTPRLICLIGAESTGKTTLAQALATHFDGLWVPEYLRTFCDHNGRTPTQAEQARILQTQVEHESESLVRAGQQGKVFVFCDTAPLLTAIYSDYVFQDRSLYRTARQWHARYALTLHLRPDLPWVADGHQRDGPHVRPAVDALIAQELASLHAATVGVAGEGAARLVAAVAALATL